jgi:type II secretory ATPase GspE/PulE/Tfp pilus assembly ATPase PilB-like protein
VTDLSQLGMRGKLRDTVRKIVSQPHGLFLVCGPTGSGKSTTLCACLFQIDRKQKNVITVEDPVEYHIDHVTQIEVNVKAGKTFANELRSILRQDPDVILIGEVRDEETAEIACKAAQTGHMVFSTVHSNDAVGAINRLVEYVKPFQIASALSGILSQRLVRKLCPKCKIAYRPNPELLKKMNLPADKIKAFYRAPKADERPEPCENCSGTGYRGRTGVFELLVVNERLRELIRDGFNAEAVKQEAVKNGMVYLQHDGMRVVIEGNTSIDEIMRVAK